MTRREELQEAYEDAMFALLMDYVAESEGKKALEENRALQEDPDAEVPQEVRRACLKEIRRAFRKKSARSVGRITMKVINKVAIVALVGTFNDGVSFHISSPSASEWTDLDDLHPAFVPEGFEMIEEDTFAGDFWVYYENNQGDRLEIDVSRNGSFDTEGAKIEPIQVCGIPAYLIDQTNLSGDKHGIAKVIVVNETDGYILSVNSTPHSALVPAPIDRETIIQIAESIFE